MDDYKIYIGGEFRETSTPLEVLNPSTGKTFAATYLGASEELDFALAGAKKVKEEMKNLSSHQRFEILRQISEEITLQRKKLALLLCRESAKPMRYALVEIDRAAQTFLIAAEESKRLPKEYLSLDWTTAGQGKEGLVKYFPIGIVAGIAPFNFPLNLAVHKIAPAIAAGCPIVLKPASATPLSTLELAKIIDKTALPKGAVSILPMNRKDGNRLVTDERFQLLSFTGSPVVGWEMKKNAGKKKVVLELGGNAAVIVTPTADLEKAVSKCLVGGFAYSGQVCIHAQRIYVQENSFIPFVSKFIEGIKKIKYGNPEDLATEISSMIDEENAIRVENWMNEAVQEGAKILHGGKRKGNYLEPSLISDTKNTMKICAEENFGPVVIIEKYSTFSEAIKMVNDTRFGLQAGVFTNDLTESDFAFNHLEVGGVILNDVPSFRVDHMPYGGVKDSGLGREGVKYAIMDMMESRIMVK